MTRRQTLSILALLMISVIAYGYTIMAVAGVRRDQSTIVRNVTQVTKRVTEVNAVVSRSPCANRSRVQCLRLLIAAATPTDLQQLRGPRGFTGPRGQTGARGIAAPQGPGLSGTPGD